MFCPYCSVYWRSRVGAVIMRSRCPALARVPAPQRKGTGGGVRVRRSLDRRRRGLPSSVSLRRGNGSRVLLRAARPLLACVALEYF